mgnify:FL=1|tara:strand:+ start:61 stop:168 length:108 start_codon:yes stop_codon:yes gene_type:complete
MKLLKKIFKSEEFFFIAVSIIGMFWFIVAVNSWGY